VALLFATASNAACRSPLPTESLRALDDRVDIDPAAVNAEVQRRLEALRDSDPLQAAELYAISADAFSLLDDDQHVLPAIAESRARLRQLPDSEAIRSLQVRLDVTEADSPRTPKDMEASVDKLTRLEQSLAAKSLNRACLLIVRSRLNTQLARDDEATADGIAAYRLTTALHDSAATADAAYQLAMTYVRAGLLEDALRLADEAATYNRAAAQTARLSNALYIKADILEQMGHFNEALTAITDARALNVKLNQAIDVAFDDQKKCSILLALQKLDAASSSCLGAERVLAEANRPDLVSVIEGDLARIDMLRNNPAAAITRLDRILRSPSDHVPARTLPKLYRYRSDALTRVGRFEDALRDLQEASRLTEARIAERRSLAAARLKERSTAELINQEKQALEAQMRLERQEAASQVRQARLRLALATAAGLLFVSIAYLMWNRARHERALRRATETLEAQAHVLSSVREGVLLVDDRGVIKYANEASQRLFGRESARLAGSSSEILGIRTEWLQAPGTETSAGLPAGARELQLVDGKGQPMVVLLTCSSVTLGDEHLNVCVLQDVTELRRLERDVLSAASGERGQMSSEVHEGIAQDLAGIALLLRGAAGKFASDSPTLELAIRHVNEVLERSRALAKGLSPVLATGGSLPTALARLANELSANRGIRVTCDCDIGDLSLSPTESDHLYRIAQGCVQLASRHKNLREIGIDLRATRDALTLTICADGAIPPEAKIDDERDWATIAYLARVSGGAARIQAQADGTGCRIISIPLASLDSRRLQGPAPNGTRM